MRIRRQPSFTTLRDGDPIVTGHRHNFRIMAVSGLASLALLLPVGAYVHFDQETAALTDEVRRTAPGGFVRLGDGYVHYELSGSRNARTVVLVHGFSVPYYIWDPTAAALAGA